MKKYNVQDKKLKSFSLKIEKSFLALKFFAKK